MLARRQVTSYSEGKVWRGCQCPQNHRVCTKCLIKYKLKEWRCCEMAPPPELEHREFPTDYPDIWIFREPFGDTWKQLLKVRQAYVNAMWRQKQKRREIIKVFWEQWLPKVRAERKRREKRWAKMTKLQKLYVKERRKRRKENKKKRKEFSKLARREKRQKAFKRWKANKKRQETIRRKRLPKQPNTT